MSEPPEQDWKHTVLVGLGALAIAAVGLGLIVGVVTAAAAQLSGVGDDSASSGTPASLYMPSYSPTPTERATESVEPPNVSAVPLDPTDLSSDQAGDITLTADAAQVSPGQKIGLTGSYSGADGVVLQVQRRDGAAWVDFPVEATVRGGTFQTYLYTSRTGEQLFRVFDPTTGRSSASVTVTVG
ncbi:MAG: hypothetical protein QM655_06480 [Nocardioidaceae bacterium]